MLIIKRAVKNILPYGLIKLRIQKEHSKINRDIIIDCENKFSGKVFCIGFNKTGTTSLEFVLKKFGYKLGDQSIGEMLCEDWYNKRTDRIISFCETADAFQDLPFSLPGIYKELDKNFPNSKFILSVRDNEEQWYKSLVNFHIKLFSTNKPNLPTEEDLANSRYVYKGFILDLQRMFRNYPDVKLYDEGYLKKQYINHIQEVKSYFKSRTEDLFVLNMKKENSYSELADFLNVIVDKELKFPWLNKA